MYFSPSLWWSDSQLIVGGERREVCWSHLVPPLFLQNCWKYLLSTTRGNWHGQTVICTLQRIRNFKITLILKQIAEIWFISNILYPSTCMVHESPGASVDCSGLQWRCPEREWAIEPNEADCFLQLRCSRVLLGSSRMEESRLTGPGHWLTGQAREREQ